MELIKRIKTFLRERNYLWLNPRFKDKTPNGILLLKDSRPNLFFSAEEFAYALQVLTGKKIYIPQIQHCLMKTTHPQGRECTAWLWKKKRFCYFAPVGSSEIYLALNRQYQTTPLKKAEILVGEYTTQDYEADITLTYRISEELTIHPQSILLKTDKGLSFFLAQYAPKDKIQTALVDIKNWKKRKLDLHSCSCM